jgi:hypothetical protein
MARKKMVKKETLIEDEVLDDDEIENVEDTVDEDQASDNAASIAMKPSNKMEAMKMAVNLIGIMPQDMAINCLDQMLQMIGQEAQNIPDSAAAHNAGTLAMKPSFASAGMTESIKEAITEIFGGETELSDEFREKAETIFEAALSTRVALEREKMREELQEEADAQVDEALTTLTEQLDQYLDYITEAWVQENEVAIESTLKSEIMEELVYDLKEVLHNHNIEFPDDKVDVIEALGEKVEALEAQLNDAINQNLELAERLESVDKEELINRMTEGLVLTQKEKFKTLVEGIDFETPETFERKLLVVKNKYFPTKGDKSTGILQEDVIENDTEEEKKLDPVMDVYAKTLSHMIKR